MARQSESVSTVAINAKVCASSGTLHAISGESAAAEEDNRHLIAKITESVGDISDSLRRLAYNLSVASLQGEIGTHFLRELRQNQSDASLPELLTLLSQANEGSQKLFDQLDQTDDWFRGIATLTEQLQRNAKTLRFIRMAGVTESALLPKGHAFPGLFDEVQHSITSIMGTCVSLRESIKDCQSTIQTIDQRRHQLSAQLQCVSSGADCLRRIHARSLSAH